MLRNKIIIAASVLFLLAGVSSCRRYLNVNQNPNGTPVATVQTLLPAAQLQMASALGVDLEIDGSFWAEYWTQNPNASQYTNLDKYTIGQDGFSNPWTNLYAAAENFHQLAVLADTQKLKQYKAISVVMQAYTFQLITDAWGDVPFSQALKGQYIDGHNVNPKYDSQSVIYPALIKMVDSSLALMNTADANHPSTDDLVYGGDMSKWIKFANTLKLRMLIRESEVNPTGAQAGITALFATNPAFLGVGDGAQIKYGFSTSNKNPLYAEEAGLNYTQNLAGSSTCINQMWANNQDPRVGAFYTPAGSNFVGLTQGIIANNITAGSFSVPSATVGGNAQDATSSNAPVNLLTSYESYFLQAEAAAHGWTGFNDSTLFAQGVLASFEEYSNAINNVFGEVGDTAFFYYYGSVPDAVYPVGGTFAAKQQAIITQKYYAMCGNQGFEAWSEFRRTGFPNFLVYPLFASPKQFPKRFLYPTSESTVNANYPGLQPLTSKVWWDLL